MVSGLRPFDPSSSGQTYPVHGRIAIAVHDDAEPATDRLLDVDEAGAILGMSRTWLYKNAHRLPFARRFGARTLKFSSNGIRRYVASRRAT